MQTPICEGERQTLWAAKTEGAERGREGELDLNSARERVPRREVRRVVLSLQLLLILLLGEGVITRDVSEDRDTQRETEGD